MSLQPAATRARPSVYLAGPDVFFPEHESLFAGLKAECAAVGLEGVSPIDAQLPAEARAHDEAHAQAIYDGNLRLIDGASAVLANLQPFRGIEPDSGTVFEVGWAIARGKLVVAYGVPPGSYAERVSASIPCVTSTHGHVTEIGSGITVEGLGQRLNLMLSRSVLLEQDAGAAIARIARVLQATP